MIDAVFIDRDGTIGGTGHFIHPSDFKPYPFSLEANDLLKEAGIKVFALTNQHRISRGQATIDEFLEEFANYGFDDAFICPHRPEDLCECHKPKPGMLLKAAKKHRLDLTKCVVIGDVGATDMLAASEVGATKILVKTGWGLDSLGNYRHPWAHVEPDFIAENLLDAVHWLLNRDFLHDHDIEMD
ncbi:HAD-IIIA family hydrolase [Chungangia koreensis]|uniref:D,D-heptose 1,7-bisphosphate phosphatase n=1 Tax=Chungangia koreensis TaxID=752657 RepID=A0ABV8X4B3_9LACT